MSFPTNPSVAVIGSGAVGGYYGARLAQHGVDVHFLLRSDYQAVRERGFAVESHDGNFSLSPDAIHAYDDVKKMPPVDLVVIALKTTSNHLLEALVKPLLNETTALLTLQNGLGNEEYLAERFGAGRVLGGLCFVCINRVGPGVIRHTDHGLIRLGDFTGPTSRTPRAVAVAELFQRCKIHCDVLDDLRFGRWEKLVWNVPFNGLGAALDLPTDAILASDDGKKLVFDLMKEVISIARAVGVRMDESTAVHQLERTPSMGAYRTSMQVDRQEGRPLEIDAIFGRPLHLARQQGLSVPNLEWVYRMVGLVNSGKMHSSDNHKKIVH